MELEKKYGSESTLKEQVLSESMKNIEKALAQIDAFNHEISTLTSTYMRCTEVFQAELQQKKQEMQENTAQLGERPAPKQMYREVTRTKKTFLFFTKTWKEMEENGYDYTECEAWDDKKKSVDSEYNAQLDEVYDLMKYKASEISRILKLQKELAELLAQQVILPETSLEDKSMNEQSEVETAEVEEIVESAEIHEVVEE